MITIKNMTKIYNPKSNAPVFALDDVSVKIGRGEMVAIMGVSGAGKSTLLHMIGCLDQPTKAEYMLNDIAVDKKNNKELSKIRNQTFGFVMQNFALITDATVLRNVTVPLMFNKTPYADIRGRGIKALSALNVDTLANRSVSTLSGGEKQRVAIARALINNPDIILADEPTGALDTKNTEIIMEIFKKLNELGKTIVIVTHEESVAERCKRIITMSDGKITNDIVACSIEPLE